MSQLVQPPAESREKAQYSVKGWMAARCYKCLPSFPKRQEIQSIFSKGEMVCVRDHRMFGNKHGKVNPMCCKPNRKRLRFARPMFSGWCWRD